MPRWNKGKSLGPSINKKRQRLKENVFKFSEEELSAIIYVIAKMGGQDGLLKWIQESPEHEALFRQYQIKCGFDLVKHQLLSSELEESGVNIQVQLTGYGNDNSPTTSILSGKGVPETNH